MNGWKPPGPVALAGLAPLGVLACLLVCTRPARVAESAEDAFPVRRVLIDAQRVPEILQQRKELVVVPRSGFEQALERAKRRARAAQSPPRVLEARYDATLEGNRGPNYIDEHLAGRAEWKLHNPHGESMVMPLAPWNLALGPGATLDQGPALLGEFPGGPGLLVPPGVHSFQFAWSLRAAEAGVAGLQFNLESPAAPIAVVQLDLPSRATILPVSGASFMQTASASGRSTWRAAVGGQAQVAFRVRREQESGQHALLQVRQQARFTVTPAGIESEFELDLDAVRGRFSELTLECPLLFEPRGVVLRHPLSWSLASQQVRNHLTVPLAEPLEGRAVLVLSGWSPLRLGERTRFEPVRVVDALPGSETLEIRVSSDLSLGDWMLAGFRPSGFQADREGFDVVSLAQADLSRERSAAPSARVQRARPDLLVRQDCWWRIDVDGSSLSARIAWEARSGSAHRLSVQLPAGWAIADLRQDVRLLEPARLARAAVEKDGPRRLLTLELATPLEAHRAATATVRLQAESASRAASDWLAVPELAPLEGRLLSSTLAVTFGPGLGPAEQALPVASTPPPVGGEFPWTGQVPELYYQLAGQPLRGRLRLHRLPVQVRSHITSEVVLAQGRRLIRYSVRVQPVSGTPSRLRLHFTAPAPELHWSVAGGRNEVLKQLEPVQEDSAGAGPDQGGLWQLTLARPLTEPLLLRAEGRLSDGRERELELPLVSLAGSARREGVLIVRLPPGRAARFEAAGVEPVEPPASASDDSPPIWRAFRYGPEPSRFRLLDILSPDAGSGGALVDDITVHSQVDDGGRFVSRYACTVRGLSRQTVRVSPPQDARLLGVWKDRAWLQTAQTASGGLELPCGERAARYELVYTQSGRAGGILLRLPTALPQWEPGTVVLANKRFWRLPSAWLPLSPAGMERVRGVSTDAPPFAPAFNAGFGSSQAPSAEARLAILSEAYLAWERSQTLAKPSTIDAALRQIDARLLREGRQLVVDEEALREAGVSLRGPLPEQLPQDFWAAAGLAVLPVRSAFVLTTPRQLSAWTRETADLEARLQPMIAEAWNHGHDRSGRYRLVCESLALGPGELPAQALQRAAIEVLETPGPVWETSETAGSFVLCVRAELCHGLGVVLALALLLAALQQAPSPRRAWFGWLWFVPSAAIVLWAPPALATASAWLVATSVVWMVSSLLYRSLVKESTHATRSERSVSPVATVVVLFVALASTAQMKPTGPTTVYLVPGPPDRPEDGTALAPGDWWAKLQQWQEESPPGRPEYIFVSADYSGTLGSAAARLEAVYQVYLLREGPVDLELPIGNVRLANLLLDGAPALATTIEPDRGYRVEVKGKGPHSIRLQFEIDVSGVGEIRCPIPRVSASRLKLRTTGALQAVDAVGALGGQSWAAAPAALLEADLGRAAELRVRRRQVSSERPRVQVRETHFWTIRPGEQALHSVLHYQPLKGEIAAFRLALPPGLEVRGVAVRAEPDRPNPPVLRDWREATGDQGRLLHLDLRSPTATPCDVALDLVARSDWPSALVDWKQAGVAVSLLGRGATPVPDLSSLASAGLLTATAELPLPTPLDAERLGGVLAYRAVGLRVEPLIARELKPLLNPVAVGLPLLGKLEGTTAFSFAPGTHPRLLVRARSASAVRQSHQDLKLTITPTEAELQAVLRLEGDALGDALGDPLGHALNRVFIEYELPPALVLSQVRGADLQRWTQRGDRLQLWLRPASARSMELVASGVLTATRDREGSGTLPLPSLRLLDAPARTSTRLDVLRRGAVSVRWERLRGFRELTGPPVSADVAVSFVSKQAEAGGVLRVAPRPAVVEAQATLRLSPPASDRVPFVINFECRLAVEGEQALSITLSNWHGDDLRADGDSVRDFRRKLTNPGDIECVLLLAPGTDRLVTFSLHGTLPVERDGRVVLPTPVINGADRTERWLAAWPKELRPLESLARPNANGLYPWPIGAQGPLTLQARSEPQGRLSPRVEVVEYETRISALDRALHEARYQVLHRPGVDWPLRLPAECELLAARVNAMPVAVDRGADVRVPLPAFAGHSEVTIQWTQPRGEGGRVLLSPPTSEPGITCPAVWTLHASGGSTPVGTAYRNGPAGAVQRALTLAEGFSRISEELIRRSNNRATPEVFERQLVRANERFYQLLDEADHRLAAADEDEREELGGLCKQLRAHHAQRFARSPWERLRRRGEETGLQTPDSRLQTPDSRLSPSGGTPWYQLFPENPARAEFLLRPPSETRFRMAFAWTALLVTLATLCAGLLSRPRTAESLERLWPEALVAAGLGGWLFLGVPQAGLVAAIGALARVVLVSRWLASATRRANRAVAALSHGHR